MCITKQQDNIAAEKKSIGFDYQFLYFIYILLGLEGKQTVGYEVKDDVHLELSDGRNIYMQLKHTLAKNNSNITINLTEKDIDLWKSIYNWLVIIEQVSLEENERIKFIKNIRFLLVTNKEEGENKFFDKVKQVQDGNMVINDFKEYVIKLKSSCKGVSKESEKLKSYMKKLIDQDDNILAAFIKNLDIEFSFDEVPSKLRDRILSKYVDSNKVADILNEVVGAFTMWKFDLVKNNKKIIINCDEVNKKVKPIFARGVNISLPKMDVNITLPDKLDKQNFIQELLAIEEIEVDDISSMTRLTTIRLKILNLFNKWLEDGYINESETKELIDDAILKWENQHKQSHKQSKREDKKSGESEANREIFIDCAQDCLYEIRKEQLIINRQLLNTSESNGVFYNLSEQEKIGWQYCWKEVYK